MVLFPTLCKKTPELPTLCKETFGILPPGAPKAPEVFLHRVGSFFVKVGREIQNPQKFFCIGSKRHHLGPARSFFIRVLTVPQGAGWQRRGEI